MQKIRQRIRPHKEGERATHFATIRYRHHTARSSKPKSVQAIIDNYDRMYVRYIIPTPEIQHHVEQWQAQGKAMPLSIFISTQGVSCNPYLHILSWGEILSVEGTMHQYDLITVTHKRKTTRKQRDRINSSTKLP